MKKALLLLFIFVSFHIASSAQKVVVSPDGNKIVGTLSSSCTRADLDSVVNQLRAHDIILTVTEVKFDDSQHLRQISFDVKTPRDNATYNSSDLASTANGIRIVIDQSPGAKTALCVGNCLEEQ